MKILGRSLVLGLVVSAVGAVGGGCANVRPKTSYSAIGNADPAREREIVDT
jgi:hypothetical protein